MSRPQEAVVRTLPFTLKGRRQKGASLGQAPSGALGLCCKPPRLLPTHPTSDAQAPVDGQEHWMLGNAEGTPLPKPRGYRGMARFPPTGVMGRMPPAVCRETRPLLKVHALPCDAGLRVGGSGARSPTSKTQPHLWSQDPDAVKW